MKGRKRKPLELQIAEGDTRQRGKHKLEAKLRSLPRPTRGLLECPKQVKGLAREAFMFYAAELEDMQLDARCDVGMLEGACVAYARAVEADLRLKKEGTVVREAIYRSGRVQSRVYRVKKHPSATVSRESWDAFKAFCSEFGLSPAARVRLAVTPPSDPRADVEAVLSGPTLTDEEKQKMQ